MLADCSQPEFDDRPFAQYGITRESMLRLIHARDANGRWFIGVDVFEAAYGAAGFAVLARLWGNRRLRPVLEKKPYFLIYETLAAASVGKPSALPTVGSVGGKPVAFAFVLFLDGPQPGAKDTEKTLTEVGEAIRQNEAKAQPKT